jgi:hypothetical protein
LNKPIDPLFDRNPNNFFGLLSDHFNEINASMWATLRTWLVLRNGPWKEFPPPIEGRRSRYFGVPDGIIAHLTRESGGNVHDRHVVGITSGSFEKETCAVNPQHPAKNPADGWRESNAERPNMQESRTAPK